jgi:hypothetical protein
MRNLPRLHEKVNNQQHDETDNIVQNYVCASLNPSSENSSTLVTNIKKPAYISSGYDERYTGKSLVDRLKEKKEHEKQMEKLVKFNYQMKLLKKLENSDYSEFKKLEAISEYQLLFEKNKYISKIDAGGLYHFWDDLGF